MDEQKVIAVAVAMVAYDKARGPKTWRELARVAVAAAEEFDRQAGGGD